MKSSTAVVARSMGQRQSGRGRSGTRIKGMQGDIVPELKSNWVESGAASKPPAARSKNFPIWA